MYTLIFIIEVVLFMYTIKYIYTKINEIISTQAIPGEYERIQEELLSAKAEYYYNKKILNTLLNKKDVDTEELENFKSTYNRSRLDLQKALTETGRISKSSDQWSILNVFGYIISNTPPNLILGMSSCFIIGIGLLLVFIFPLLGKIVLIVGFFCCIGFIYEKPNLDMEAVFIRGKRNNESLPLTEREKELCMPLRVYTAELGGELVHDLEFLGILSLWDLQVKRGWVLKNIDKSYVPLIKKFLRDHKMENVGFSQDEIDYYTMIQSHLT